MAEKFETIGYRNLRKSGLAEVWAKANVLRVDTLLRAVLSEDALSAVRRVLRKSTGVSISVEDIVGGIRHLLNEGAVTEMENLRISLPARNRSKRVTQEKAN